VQDAVGKHLAPHAAPPAHGFVGTRGEHLIHPGHKDVQAVRP
jgi:hypothetical protein